MTITPTRIINWKTLDTHSIQNRTLLLALPQQTRIIYKIVHSYLHCRNTWAYCTHGAYLPVLLQQTRKFCSVRQRGVPLQRAVELEFPTYLVLFDALDSKGQSIPCKAMETSNGKKSERYWNSIHLKHLLNCQIQCHCHIEWLYQPHECAFF